MTEQAVPVTPEAAFAALLSEDATLDAAEPEVAAAIREQLVHMALDALPPAAMRRVRDIAARVRPDVVLEVGAGIGTLSAWLMDHWQDADHRPHAFRLVEGGGKFGIILERLIKRSDALVWAQVVVGDWTQLVQQAHADRKGLLAGADVVDPDARLPTPADLIILDTGAEVADHVLPALSVLSRRGLMLVVEPATPLKEETPAEPSEGCDAALWAAWQGRVEAYQRWIDLVPQLAREHVCGFVQVEHVSLFAMMRRRR